MLPLCKRILNKGAQLQSCDISIQFTNEMSLYLEGKDFKKQV